MKVDKLIYFSLLSNIFFPLKEIIRILNNFLTARGITFKSEAIV